MMTLTFQSTMCSPRLRMGMKLFQMETYIHRRVVKFAFRKCHFLMNHLTTTLEIHLRLSPLAMVLHHQSKPWRT